MAFNRIAEEGSYADVVPLTHAFSPCFEKGNNNIKFYVHRVFINDNCKEIIFHEKKHSGESLSACNGEQTLIDKNEQENEVNCP